MHLAVHGYRLEGYQTGVARYLTCLLREWEHDPGPFETIRLFSRHRRGDPRVSAFRGVTHVPLTPWLPYVVCEQLLLRWAARADVLFCPANTIPVGYRGPCVVTIHDTLQEVVPETFPWWSRFRHGPLYCHSARQATLVLTDSENSRRDIVSYYGVKPEKVRVIPLAAAPCFRCMAAPAIAATRQRFGLGDLPYVLFVGKLSVRRNVPLMLHAFARALGTAGIPHRLVLVGANHRSLPLDRWVAETGLAECVTHLPRVSDDELATLYSGATCLVLPSTYEGFGLPILEAMACACPVVTFRNSSLAEVGADAAFYPQDQSEEALAEGLAEVLHSPTLRDDLKSRGLRRAEQFSWQRTATETLHALAEAAGRSRTAHGQCESLSPQPSHKEVRRCPGSRDSSAMPGSPSRPAVHAADRPLHS